MREALSDTQAIKFSSDDVFRTSVLLAVYNGAVTLDRALRSIAAQSCPVDQVVLVNDGSQDGTAQIADRWRSILPLTIITNPTNLGLTNSLRIAAEMASADILLRIDADDEWLPNHCDAIVTLARKHKRAVLFASIAELCDEFDKRIGQSDIIDNKTVRRRLFWDNPLVHSSTAFRWNTYQEVGGYLGPTYAEDYDLWIRLLKNGEFAFTNKLTLKYYVSDGSLSRIRRQAAIDFRLNLQFKAIRAFFVRHPVRAFATTFVVAFRKILNRFNLA